MIGYQRRANGNIVIYKDRGEGLLRAQDEIELTLRAGGEVTVYDAERFPYWHLEEKK